MLRKKETGKESKLKYWVETNKMIYIGIGSNLSSSFGDRFKNITLAIDYFQSNKIKLNEEINKVLQISEIYLNIQNSNQDSTDNLIWLIN